MVGDELGRAGIVLTRSHPQADHGGRRRDDLVRHLVRARGVEREHVDRRFRQRPFRDRSGSEQPNLGVDARLGSELLLGDVDPFPRERGQALDRDLAVVGVQRRDHARQCDDRVREWTAERARVDRLGQDVDADAERRRAADARGDRGHASADVPAVGDDRDVGPQEVGVPVDEVGQVLGRTLLLALDDDLDRDGRVTVCQERPDRGGVDRDPALVVGAPAPEEAVAGDRGLERRVVPVGGVGGWLHVVVRVQQDRRRPGRSGPLAEDRGVPAVELEQPDVGEAGVPQDRRGRLRARAHVRGVVAGVTDRGDRDEPGELLDDPRPVAGDPFAEVVHGAGGYRAARVGYGYSRSMRQPVPSRV